MLIPQGFKQLKGDTGTTEMVVYVSDKGVGHVRTSQPVDDSAGKRYGSLIEMSSAPLTPIKPTRRLPGNSSRLSHPTRTGQ